MAYTRVSSFTPATFRTAGASSAPYMTTKQVSTINRWYNSRGAGIDMVGQAAVPVTLPGGRVADRRVNFGITANYNYTVFNGIAHLSPQVPNNQKFVQFSLLLHVGSALMVGKTDTPDNGAVSVGLHPDSGGFSTAAAMYSFVLGQNIGFGGNSADTDNYRYYGFTDIGIATPSKPFFCDIVYDISASKASLYINGQLVDKNRTFAVPASAICALGNVTYSGSGQASMYVYSAGIYHTASVLIDDPAWTYTGPLIPRVDLVEYDDPGNWMDHNGATYTPELAADASNDWFFNTTRSAAKSVPFVDYYDTSTSGTVQALHSPPDGGSIRYRITSDTTQLPPGATRVGYWTGEAFNCQNQSGTTGLVTTIASDQGGTSGPNTTTANGNQLASRLDNHAMDPPVVVDGTPLVRTVTCSPKPIGT